MRIKKKNIGENLKNTEEELNAIKGMVNQTSDELRNMGMDDKKSKEIAVNVVTKSYVDSKNDEYVKTEDIDPGTGEDFEDIGPGGDIEAKADDYEKFQELLRDLEGYSKEIEDMDDGEPMNDLPFESVRPKMTKDELIESVKRNTTKKRKVIKTISVKNLRNE